jgi:hypothetical protein
MSHCSVIECFSSTGFKRFSAELKPFNHSYWGERHKSPHSLTTKAYGFLKLQRRFHQRGCYTTRILRTEYPMFRLCGTIIFNVPVIYNTSHLSVLVGYKEYLKKAALHTKYFYRDFEVVKRNGKKDPYLNHCPV